MDRLLDGTMAQEQLRGRQGRSRRQLGLGWLVWSETAGAAWARPTSQRPECPHSQCGTRRHYTSDPLTFVSWWLIGDRRPVTLSRFPGSRTSASEGAARPRSSDRWRSLAFVGDRHSLTRAASSCSCCGEPLFHAF